MKLFGLTLGEVGKLVEGCRFARPGEPLRARIEDEKHAPCGREGEPGSELRQSISGTRASIEDCAALLEGEDADAGAPAALKSPRDLLRR